MAPHLQFDARSPYHLGPFRIGFSAGLDFTKADQSLAFSNFSATQTREDFRLDYGDRYDLDGVIPPMAPCAGSLGGPGPLISNIPIIRTSTPVLISTDTGSFGNQVSSSIEIEYAVTRDIGIGGFLRLDAAGEFRARAGPTVSKIDPYGVTAGVQIRFALD